MGLTYSQRIGSLRLRRNEFDNTRVPESVQDAINLDFEIAASLKRASSAGMSEFDMERLLKTRTRVAMTLANEETVLLPENCPLEQIKLSTAVFAGFEMSKRKICQDFVAVRTLKCRDGRVYLFLAVFDGHGINGREIAMHSANAMPDALFMLLNESTNEAKCLTKAFVKVHHMIETQSGPFNRIDAWTSGATASIALAHGRKLWVANVGDSQVHLVGRTIQPFLETDRSSKVQNDHSPSMKRDESVEDNKVLCSWRVSSMHNFEDQKEIDRAVKAGGHIRRAHSDKRSPLRVFSSDQSAGPGLVVSRSLGDLQAHLIGVSCEPDVSVLEIEPTDEFIVLASDGVWDVRGPGNVARDILDFVGPSGDDANSSDAASMSNCAKSVARDCSYRWVCRHLGIVDDISIVVGKFVHRVGTANKAEPAIPPPEKSFIE